MIKPATAILVDRRNYDNLKLALIDKISAGKIIGIDIETDNRKAHEGILAFNKGKKNVFDLHRQVMTGLSIYVDGDDAAYYFNLTHHDVENRLTWDEVKVILDAKPDNALWIAHNSPFEITMFSTIYKYDLKNVICTLQMAVSAYGPDEYDVNKLYSTGLGGITKILGPAAVHFANYKGRNNMTAAQAEVFNQVTGKQSKADHSFNGLIKSVSYGYGLKQAVKSHFGYSMVEYETVLNGKDGMMDLTGDEVVSYGCDDAFWCVQLFHHLKAYMLKTNPTVLKTFLTQELPMTEVFADCWKTGVKIDLDAVRNRRQVERGEYAAKLRELKIVINKFLPFKDAPHTGLFADDKMYVNLYQKYRRNIVEWAETPDVDDDYETVAAVSGAVSDAWVKERGGTKGPLNFSYYVTQRILMYDLIEEKCIKAKGAVQSDGEARGKLIERLADQPEKKALLELLNDMSSIEQRMKLYLNPYNHLTDPDTQKLHPAISSKLATRRMAMTDPNAQQLAKRGESTYIRGFYKADEEDHVIVSLDWSSFELVIIGELSKDPGFFKAFGQLPFGDLHTDATVNCLQVTIPEITHDIFKKLHLMSVEEINDVNPKILITPSGQHLSPQKAKKYWRTEVGKGANFNYFYSGALSSVGDKLGWTSDQMWEATERYRDTFPVAEEWRVNTIKQLQRDGYITLPDGHRRVRFEATAEFSNFFTGQFSKRQQLLNLSNDALTTFGREVTKSIQTRANNQGVNSLVQGTNATCAKRSIIRINKEIKELGLRARFMFPVHDELVFSVHREDAVALIALAKRVMRSHEDIFTTLKLDCTASVGLNFEPWDAKKAPKGQIELDEIQNGILDLKDGSQLTEDQIQRVVDEYLFA